jgi:hypothetical protein
VTEDPRESRGLRATRRSSRGTPHGRRERPAANAAGRGARTGHTDQCQWSSQVRPSRSGRMLGVDSRATRVLEEIKATVEKRVHSGPEPTRKRDVLLASIRKKAKDTKSKYKYQDELEQMRRKLQSVVDGFMVRILRTRYAGAESVSIHVQISSLLRNELSSLQNGSDLNDVRMLASRILELQMRQDVKRDAEAGEWSTQRLICMNYVDLHVSVRAKQDAELIKRDADIGEHGLLFVFAQRFTFMYSFARLPRAYRISCLERNRGRRRRLGARRDNLYVHAGDPFVYPERPLSLGH